MRTPLQQWANANKPDENLNYKGGYWSQIMFVRDRLAPLVSIGLSFEEFQDKAAFVISTHRSKSVTLPVYLLEPPGKGIKFVLRDNFYNWKVSVISERPVKVDPLMLFQADPPDDPSWSGDVLASCYFEGFPGDLIFGYYNQSDKKQFSVEIGGDYDLYVFIRECMRSLEQVRWAEIAAERRADSLRKRDEWRASIVRRMEENQPSLVEKVMDGETVLGVGIGLDDRSRGGREVYHVYCIDRAAADRVDELTKGYHQGYVVRTIVTGRVVPL